MTHPWLELVAAVFVALDQALAAGAGKAAGSRDPPDLNDLSKAAPRRFSDAWRRQCQVATEAIKSLGIPPAPLMTSEALWPRERDSGEEFEWLRLRVLSAARDTAASLAQDRGADPLATRFEAVRSCEGRRRQGQHLTPATVADLTLGLAGMPEPRRLLDPTCGTGTFLLRAAAWPGLAPEANLWGSDLDPLAVQLAQINLARFPRRSARIARLDAFSLRPGLRLGGAPLPPPDAVVGNLPYVRLHHLDPESTAGTLADLAHRWRARDPALVLQKRGEAPRLRLGGSGDLYAMLLFHLAEVMPPPTRFSLLTSNAWLDDRYGAALRDLLCRHFTIHAVVESQCERWFPGAAVNTLILSARRRQPGQRGKPAPPPCRFVSIHQPLGAPGSDATPRRLARNILEGPGNTTLRILEIPQATLWTDPAPEPDSPGQRRRATRHSSGWSVHLRGTPIYRLLAEARGIIPAGEWLLVRRGLTTNCNAFFYPKGPEAEGIEPEYLLPVVRSPRMGETGLLIHTASLATRLFHCSRTEAELRALGHVGALAWIARGTGMTTRRGRPLPEVLTGRPWYAIRPQPHRVVFTKAIHDSHRHRLLDMPTPLDQRMYGVAPRDHDQGAASSAQMSLPSTLPTGLPRAHQAGRPSTYPAGLPDALLADLPSTLVAAALNSSISALSAEVIGSTNLGEGALDLPVGRVSESLLVPHAQRLSRKDLGNLLAAFASLASRPLGSVWQELSQPDRKALDEAWLSGLGLPLGWLPAIEEALEERVRLRLQRAACLRRPTAEHGE